MLQKRIKLESRDKYGNYALSDSEVEAIGKRIEFQFELEKVYKDPEMDLQKLSGIIGIDRNKVSQVINRHFNLGYNSVINAYRIKESIRILAESGSKSIKEVIYEVGYSNKSTFYKAFKEQTNTTPKAYSA